MEHIVSGNQMLIGLLAGIVILICLVLMTKVQAFLALILATVIVGVIGGMPLLNTSYIGADGLSHSGSIISSISNGFGGTLGSTVS